MRADRDHSGLLVDFGGVLTTSVWDSFADFCRDKGLEEDSMKRLFREDPAALADLRELETGRDRGEGVRAPLRGAPRPGGGRRT